MSTVIVDNLPNQEPRMATAWCTFNGNSAASGTFIKHSYNILSITETGTGVWYVTFLNDMDHIDFTELVSCDNATTSGYQVGALSGGTSTVSRSSQLVCATPNTGAPSFTTNYHYAVFGGKTL